MTTFDDAELNHPWEVTPAEARAIQGRLRECVERRDRLPPVTRVAGVDVGFNRRRGLTRAAVAVLAYPSLELIEQAIAVEPTRFPYVPGLLSFREVPASLAALDKLSQPPDLLLCDAQGYAHPRRMGLACHLGLRAGLASIGVAKTRLIGTHGEPPNARGASSELRDGAEVIGAVLRTRVGVKPLYVSIGHRVGLATAIDFVMRCCTRFRLPETTRHAHRLASGPWP